MPGIKKSQLLDDLASSLEQWSIRYSLNSDPYITGLVNSMKTRKKISFWAELHAIEMLPLPEVVSGKTLRQRMAVYLAFRNIMVFVPIAFTWAAISQATSAFATYAKMGKAKIVNFFDFWENGYDVLSQFWTLSNVARIDFFLLTSIVFVSIIISISERKLATLELNEKLALDKERLQLALNIDEALSDYRHPTPQIINRQISQSIINLNEATRALRGIAKEQAGFTRKSANYKELLAEIASVKALISRVR